MMDGFDGFFFACFFVLSPSLCLLIDSEKNRTICPISEDVKIK